MNKLPEDLNIFDFYEYSEEKSEVAALFLKYDPVELKSKKIIGRISRVYDF